MNINPTFAAFRGRCLLVLLFSTHITCVVFLVCAQLSVGAVQGHGLQKPILSNRNFHGCLENLLYNDLSLINLAKQSNHQVAVVVSYCVSASLKGRLP